MKKGAELFNLHYVNHGHEIDSKTLTATLTTITTVVEQTNLMLGTNKSIRLIVKPFNPGTFEVPIEAVETAIGGLLATSYPQVKEVVKFVIDLFTLRKFLKGEPPKTITEKGTKKEITNCTGQTFQAENLVVNLFQNNVIVGGALDDGFRQLEKDDSISEFQITDKKRSPLVTVTRDEFGYFTSLKKEVVEGKRDRAERTVLHVVRVVFEPKRRWEFYYHGVKIPAYVVDEEFLQRIHDGEAFCKGDALDVDLVITQEFDGTADTYVNRLYTITKVHTHTPRQTQMKLGTK